jgi:hypothetical protein
MLHLGRIGLVVHVKPACNMGTHIPRRMRCQLQEHLSCCTWTSLAQQHTHQLGDNKYGFVIVDDYTRYTWVFFLFDKSEVYDLFKSFVKRVQNEFDTAIKKIRSDNGSEFKNTRVE